MKLSTEIEQEHLASLIPMMKDDESLHIGIKVRDAWMVVSAIQLASRHPEVKGEQKAWMIHVAHQFQAAVTQLYPQVGQIMEMGWHPEFDVEQDNG
jgi:ribulose 1,5-bisphosphate carboxylase large subunit-like protein